MSTTFKRWGQSELLPRYIFADSIIAHQRILEIGAVASTEGMSAYFLLIKGARTVVACDSALEATQLAQAKLGAPNLTFRPMVFDGLAPASFDLIAITDLAPFIRAPTFFDQLLRLLSPRGYVLGGLRNPAGLALSQVMEAELDEPPPSYGELRDLLDSRFSSIQVATQAPVLGYQLAFDEGEGLHIEGSLASAGEAAYYVVIAGVASRPGIEPLWVQLSPEPLAFNRDKLEEAALRARKWQFRFEEQKEACEKARARLGMLEQETRQQAKQLGEAQEALERLQFQAQAPVFDASAHLELSEKVSKLSADLLVAQGRANEAEARISTMSMEVQRHVQALRESTTDALAAKESARMEREKRETAERMLQERATQVPPPVLMPEGELEEARREVASQKATIEALRHDMELLREQHLQAVSAQSEGEAEAADKAELMKKLEEQERAVHMLQSDLCAMREERDALVFQFRVRSSKQEEEQAAKEAPEDATARLQELVQELEAALRQKSDEVEAMQEDLALRSHSVERSKNRIRELESMLANAQAQSKEDSALLGSEYDKLKQENGTLRTMLESLRARFEEQRNEEANVDSQTAGTMLNMLRKRYAEQEQVLAQTRETLERTESELAAVHKQLRRSPKEEGAVNAEFVQVEVAQEPEYIEEIEEIDEADEADEIDEVWSEKKP